MNGKRRSRLDIMADMIKTARHGARKTQLVYRCNLNFKIVKRYIGYLLDNGFFTHDPPRYYATEKGCMYLTRYEALNSF